MNGQLAIDDALRGAVLPRRVHEIIQHEHQADDLVAEADEHRWEAARLIAEELAQGKSQRQLASEIGKSLRHVQLMATVHGDYLGSHDRPAFNQAYQDAKRPALIAESEPELQLLDEQPGPLPESRVPPDERNPGADTDADKRGRLERLRTMADQAESASPYMPIHELVEIRDALRRTIPKMRALRDADVLVGADALTTAVGRLCRELEELL